ncbi:MAG: ABC transporter ATP-binding protein/permease [Clostridia bacterium]|nr:ABC transporter ATP-binding protein/permease [Clostridia bacterium]
MLEIKNVTKIYRTRGGVATKALDDVSISFGETGLVFLLGKSGSGKSTLLNVSGGLDEPTSGEVIVKGKSSKDFTGSDFDSYRNTFVGFIFQEYNILDEFNVEENVALALELQGKPKDRQKINAILEEVELKELARRRPNTLSGGQKQRIAIARALVKDPQIIMADEPTGALDSATGKQVFDTLKRLSETRLVIVVSHDREFAEIYGDRIVELKDGKIISDVTKSHVEPEQLDENVSIIGGNTISIKSGCKLTQNNFKTIQEFISKADGDVIISKGETEITNFKKSNRLSDGGLMETFAQTDTENLDIKTYSKEDSKFIRSRLPASKAIRIGASGLKLKPIRLVFTIILSLIAFTTFGLFSTLMVYDGDKVATQSYVKSDIDWLNVTKTYQSRTTYDDDDWVYENNYNETKFTEDELNSYAEKYGSGAFGYYAFDGSINNVYLNKSASEEYYSKVLSKLAYVPDGNTLKSSIVAGQYPKNADEILINSYLVEVMKNSTVNAVVNKNGKLEIDTESTVNIDNAQSAVGNYLAFSDNLYLKISGVYDCGEIPSKFDDIKNGGETNFLDSVEYASYLSFGLAQLGLVSQDFFTVHKELFEDSSDNWKNYFDYADNDIELYSDYYDYDYEDGWIPSDYYEGYSVYETYYVKAYGGDNQLKTHFLDGKQRTKLSQKEVVIPAFLLVYNGFDDDVIKQLMEKQTDGDYDDAYRIYRKFCDSAAKYYAGRRWDMEVTDAERAEAYSEVVEFLKGLDPIEVEIRVDGAPWKMTVVGVCEDDLEANFNEGFYFEQDFIDSYLDIWTTTAHRETNYVEPENAIYSGVFLEYDHSESAIAELFATVGVANKAEDDSIINLNGWLYEIIQIVNETVDVLSTVFLCVGIVFAVFASLLMFNFISVSISNKRKEIGILRAVGARGLDVFKIFFSESGIIIGICTVLSILSAFLQCVVINAVLKSILGLEVTLFVFGIVSVAIMLGIAVLVAFISTFLPVFFAARKKPVESIRAL